MTQIGQPVNDGHGRFPRPLLNGGMVVRADDDPVEIARQHTSRVGHALSARQLNVAHRKDQGMTAELVHSCFEGDPRPGRRLLEQEPQRLSLEQGVRDAATLLVLELSRQRQKAGQLRLGDGGNIQQILIQSGISLRR